MGRKKKLAIVGKNQGRPLSEAQKAAVIQCYALTHNKSEVARQLNINMKTVTRVLNETAPAEIERARADTQLRLAGKTHKKAEEIIDSIGEKDLAAASLQQKAIAAGIMIDKQSNLLNSFHDLNERQAGRIMSTPGSLAALVDAIKSKFNTLNLTFDLRSEHPDLAKRVDALEVPAEVISSTPTNVQSLDEFDGFGTEPEAPIGTDGPVAEPTKP